MLSPSAELIAITRAILYGLPGNPQPFGRELFPIESSGRPILTPAPMPPSTMTRQRRRAAERAARRG